MEYNEFPNIMRRISTLSRRVRDQETAPRLYSVGIGSGGIKVYGEGDINVRDGGDINVLAGGDVSIGTGGSINVSSGGQIISDGPAKFTSSSRITGNTVISGNLNIQGTLTIPDGKIDGAFLKNQFHAQNITTSASFNPNYSGWKTLITRSVSVPSWASDMFVLMAGDVVAASSAIESNRGSVIKVYADTLESSGGGIAQVTGGGHHGNMGYIRAVNVSSKSSVNLGIKVYFPLARSGTGTAYFYATVIFVR